MSFFRPHKSKPRQFNYIPRHYDPVKEERELRRKELHGTSTEDDYEDYVPGKYIRTQREAREIARESENKSSTVSKMRNMMIIGGVIVLFALIIMPRIVNFAEMAKEENKAKEAERRRQVAIIEEYENIKGIDNAQELMMSMDDKEAWQRRTNIDGDELIRRQQLEFQVFDIITTEMEGQEQSVIDAALEEALKSPEEWLQKRVAKGN